MEAHALTSETFEIGCLYVDYKVIKAYVTQVLLDIVGSIYVDCL